MKVQRGKGTKRQSKFSVQINKYTHQHINNKMFSLGYNIRQNPPEAMGNIAPEALIALLRNADHALAADTERLRKVRQLDKTAYTTAKLGLPYIVGSTFREGLRHRDHFEAVGYLCLDLDDCFTSEATRRSLVERICRRDDVLLLFGSPSGQGLKVWARLSPPCHSTLAYKQFYRDYATGFAEAVGLVGKVDLRTCDAMRACFLAHDPDTYFNPSALTLNWESWLRTDELLSDASGSPIGGSADAEPPPTRPLTPEIYNTLRRVVNPKATTRGPKPPPFVPEILGRLPDELRPALHIAGLQLETAVPIQFGLQLRCRGGNRQAEVSIFYGKRGFSVVKSTRSQTDPDLNQTLHDLVYTFLFEPPGSVLGICLGV